MKGREIDACVASVMSSQAFISYSLLRMYVVPMVAPCKAGLSRAYCNDFTLCGSENEVKCVRMSGNWLSQNAGRVIFLPKKTFIESTKHSNDPMHGYLVLIYTLFYGID